MKQSQKAVSGFTIVELLIVVVVIAILAAITIVSYNGITQQAKVSAQASVLSQWKKKASLYRTENSLDECPVNYSFVYGSVELGTMPGFCVMKYEAKNAGGAATSQASGTPWASISQTDAITASAAAGGHLITEAEWMTIAADVLSVSYNWGGGSINSGSIYQGHINNNPAAALAASTDDGDNLNGITAGTGEGSGNNGSRVLYLSSGEAIWDLSGNVWEWTQQAVGTPTLAVSNAGVSGDSAFNWRDYTLGSLSFGTLAAVSRPGTLNSYVNSVTGLSLNGVTWDSNKGVGRMYANYADSTARAFLRGGSWSDTSRAGILTLHLNNSASSTHPSIGFRVVK